MIVRLVSAALVAGFLAAVVSTGLQLALTSPLILKAETYEAQAAAAGSDARFTRAVITGPRAIPSPLRGGAGVGVVPLDSGRPSGTTPTSSPQGGGEHGGARDVLPAHGEGHGDHGSGEDWQPAPGLERMAYTGLATLIGGVGYALLLGAVMLALRRAPTPESGLALGIAGFLSVTLAPAIGLPPELPGMGAAALEVRQLWWLMTVVGTALGLYLIAMRRTAPAIAAGLVLIVAPHVAGAPLVAEADSKLPAAYAAQFAARSLAIGFVFWAVIGLSYGWAWNLFGRREPARG